MRRVRVAWLLPLALAASRCGPDGATGPAGTGTGAAKRADERPLRDFPLETPVAGDAAAAAKHVAAARQAVGLGHPDVAKQSLQAALAADPANLEALLLRGTIGLQKSFAWEPMQALTAFRLARLVDPASLPARIGEANARVALEDDAGAAALLQELADDEAAGRTKPTEEQRGLVQRGLGQVALRGGRFEEALRHADAALAIRPTDRASLTLRAEVLERLGKLPEAVASLDVALRQRQDDSTLHFAMARLQRKLGATGEAERHAKAYQSLLPFEEDGSTSFRTDWPRRIGLRRDLVAACPEFKRGRHLLVRELLGGKEFAAARAECDALLAADAADSEAWFLQAKALAGLGDYAGARRAADEMAKTGKVAPPVHEELLREIEKTANGGK